jgi:Holliday junction resolvasome RuvABC endonuclease subunit
MISLGLDVSELRMGFAVVSYDDQRPIALGVESLRKPDGGWPETQVVRALRNIRGEVVRCGHDPEEVVVVGVEWVYKGKQSLERLAWHAAVIGMAMAVSEILFPDSTCYPLGADEWRAACGISNAGKRDDKKDATLAWAYPHVGFPAFMSFDEADALGIATAAALKTETREAA